MEPFVITDRSTLSKLLSWSLESAGITSKAVEGMVDALHEILQQKKLTSEAYDNAFNVGLADLIFKKYDAVIILPDERVMGRIGNQDEQIFDATNCKIHYDLKRL